MIFVNGSPSSALTWTFTALNSTTDDVDFSNDGGVTWTYVPVPDANGYDGAVTTLRLRPKGTMPGNAGGNPYFELRFRVTVNCITFAIARRDTEFPGETSPLNIAE